MEGIIAAFIGAVVGLILLAVCFGSVEDAATTAATIPTSTTHGISVGVPAQQQR